MGIQAMVSSYNANSRRQKKPSYFESANLNKTRFKLIRKKKATAKELEDVKLKISYQNKIENIIYFIIVIGVTVLTWWVI